jgi:HPt (histidine-containing phosphotransfer) domain-containing protein
VSLDLRDIFLPRFRVVAGERLGRMRSLGVAHPRGAAAELHALAGEAAILGATAVAELARAAEARCRQGSWASPDEWETALEEIQRAIAEA